MAKLKVRNVGPIKSGLSEDEGFIEFSGVTLFTGAQGSGKSTVAKLFSTLSWIEKALVRGDFTSVELGKYNRFKRHLDYQNLSEYVNRDSYIEYVGDAYRIVYSGERLQATVIANAGYHFPKIMYVPAERNFISAVGRPDLVKRLPLPLYSFLDEYEDAKRGLNGALELPIDGISLEYKKASRKLLIVGNDYNIDLLHASSGYQSLVPLVLVTYHLEKILNAEVSSSRKEINLEEEERIRRLVSNLMKDKKVSEEVLKAALEQISSRFRYESFVNIVEEPEQNLYPTSQMGVLYMLLRVLNRNSANRLVLTSHSPYIVHFLTLAVKAKQILSRSNTDFDDVLRVNKIVPSGAELLGDRLRIYELEASNGTLSKLKQYRDLPSDENYLNLALEDFNTKFNELLSIGYGH
jgi:predicted ATPase